jgi:hypothetical protein
MLLEIYKTNSRDIGITFENNFIIYNKQEKAYVKFEFFKQNIKKYSKEVELLIFLTDIWKINLHNYNVYFKFFFGITNKKYIIFFEP